MKVYPSMLSANPCCLGDELRELAEADGIHWDVMDGNFVEAITFGAHIIKSHREITSQVFDVHLMVANPEKHIENFAKAGADIITVHLEACGDVAGVLSHIRSRNVKAGLVIKPKTPVRELAPYLPLIDMILIMSVEPGFGGQSFIPSSLDKLREARKMIEESGYDIDLEVDGGIKPSNVKDVIEAGANVIVAGSAIFRAEDPAAAVKTLSGE